MDGKRTASRLPYVLAEDRLAALGGAVEIRSAPGSGTTIAGRLLATSTEGPQ
jgi:hypothetical protein